jgi:hypothetical protein
MKYGIALKNVAHRLGMSYHGVLALYEYENEDRYRVVKRVALWECNDKSTNSDNVHVILREIAKVLDDTSQPLYIFSKKVISGYLFDTQEQADRTWAAVRAMFKEKLCEHVANKPNVVPILLHITSNYSDYMFCVSNNMDVGRAYLTVLMDMDANGALRWLQESAVTTVKPLDFTQEDINNIPDNLVSVKTELQQKMIIHQKNLENRKEYREMLTLKDSALAEKNPFKAKSFLHDYSNHDSGLEISFTNFDKPKPHFEEISVTWTDHNGQ